MCDLEQWHEDKRLPAVERSIQRYVKQRSDIGGLLEFLKGKYKFTQTQAEDVLMHYAEPEVTEIEA